MRIGLAIAALCCQAIIARADQAVTIGAIYPLGRDPEAKYALETAADIIDAPHPGLEKLLLGEGRGLPNLGGAKIAVSVADDLANPSVAEGQALRLIAQDHVAALIGAGQSPETLAATALAERHGIPFLVPDAAAPTVTARGFKEVFRTTPLASDDAKAYAQFLGGLKQSGRDVDTVAMVFEDSDFGRSASGALGDALTAAGFRVSAIAYPAKAIDLSPIVAQLRVKNPDAAVFISHTADAILLMKTMQNAGYKPAVEIGDDAGFSDPGFIVAVGNLAQGVIDRSVWSTGKSDSPTAMVNELYKARSGRDLDEAGGRCRGSLCWPTRSTAPARPTPPRSGRHCRRPISSRTS